MKRTHQRAWVQLDRLAGGGRLQIANCKLQIANWLKELVVASRVGTTMTEVLVSLLVMSIGIVSLTSIFPLSLVRSIRAAQLTNATISRYNAEAMIEADKTIFTEIDSTALTVLRDLTATSSKAVIDPLGYYSMPSGLQRTFGNDGTNVAGTLARFNGGRNDKASADFLVTLPDSWTLLHEGAGSGLTATQVTVNNLSSVLTALPSGQNLRVTLFYPGQGRTLSVSRTAATLSGNTLTWTDALPASITTVGMVRVDQQNRNYTWLLTARRANTPPSDGTVSIDVAVFFRRSFDTSDETTHDATFQLGVRDLVVTFRGGVKPFLKKGSYIFDAENVLWYRIADIKSLTSTNATIQLDRPAAAASTGTPGKAIFMKGIVDVFHIADQKVGI